MTFSCMDSGVGTRLLSERDQQFGPMGLRASAHKLARRDA